MNKLLTSESSDSQLYELATKIGIKLEPIVFKSQLCKLPIKKKGNYIIHLENPQHWTALYIDYPKAYYFNSFDDEFGDIPQEIVDFIKKNKCYLVDIDDKPIQNPRRGYCGQYCVLWLYYMNRPTNDRYDFNSYLHLFKDTTGLIQKYQLKHPEL